MAYGNSGSAFDPTGDLAEMELLSPALPTFRRTAALTLFYASGFGISLMVVLVVAGSQLRIPAESRLINPFLVVAVFAAVFSLLRKGVIAISPAAVFYDRPGKRLVLIYQNFFGSKQVEMDAETIKKTELQNTNGKWIVTLSVADTTLPLPAFSEKGEALGTAERISKALKVELAGITSASASGSQPLYKRLGTRQPPKPNEKLGIKKQKGSEGITWDIDLPLWLTIAVLGFALANILTGAYVWIMVDKDTARWASLPFLVTTFMVFVLAAMMKSFKRPLMFSMNGISHRDTGIPLERISSIRVKPGFFSKLTVESDIESFSLLTTEKQATWLKEDIEHEIYQRRNQIDERQG